MNCRNCGFASAADARYCVRCGVALVSDAQPALQYPAGTPYAQAATDPYAARPGYGPQGIPTQRGMQNAQPQAPYYQQPPQYPQPMGTSPILPPILSVVVPGLGQFVNGDVKKGLVMLFVALVGLIPFGLGWLAAMIWSAIDAYQVASGTGKRWS